MSTNVTNEIIVTPNSGLYTSEYFSPYTVDKGTSFAVTLNTAVQMGEIVTLNITSDDVNEGTALPATLTFDDTDWNQPKMVTVTGVFGARKYESILMNRS